MRSLLALALAAPAVAFTPAVAPRKIVRGGRPLGPGFLKDLGFEKPFASLNLDEKSDEGWLDDDWDADDDESAGSGRQEGEKTTSPIVFIASPKSGSLCTSKSGTISSRDGLLECDMKAVKYDSQITLPEMEPLTPEASETMEFCEGKAVHGVLDDITADDNWLDEDWDSE